MRYKKGPAELYHHETDIIVNPNQVFKEKLTFGQKLSDRISQGMGCWWFIAIQSVIIWLFVKCCGLLETGKNSLSFLMRIFDGMFWQFYAYNDLDSLINKEFVF